jgi:hypothetical protein
VKLNKSQREMYREFNYEFTWCFACRINQLPWNWLGLQNAHLVGGSGRRADRRAIIRLCQPHHEILDNACDTGLTLANGLWLKREFDPGYYDLEYIKSLRIKHNEEIQPEEYK